MTAPNIQKLADELEEMSLEFDQLAHRQKRILELRGWKETCQTPGSVWMWEKTIADGRTLLVTFEAAWCRESCDISKEASKAAGEWSNDQAQTRRE